jgi:hypothetical protein
MRIESGLGIDSNVRYWSGTAVIEAHFHFEHALLLKDICFYSVFSKD